MNNQTGSAADSSISFRPVQPEDEDFLLELYASTRAEEMALVPWNAEQQQSFIRMQYVAQQEHYKQKYPAATHEIILSSGRPVGHRYIARLETEIRIVDMTILPHERNAEIGSVSLRGLLAEAQLAGKIVRIYVEAFNPSLRLFERLGFARLDEHGIHLLMEWSPSTSGPDLKP